MDRAERLIASFTRTRERLNEAAQKARNERDALNEGTRLHAGRRDELNAQVRAKVDEANLHRAARDASNQEVRDAKVRREELNRVAHEKADALREARREHGGPEGGVSIARLRADVQQLEYQQQTTALPPRKEKELIELIGAKLKEIKARESAMQESDALSAAFAAMQEARAAAEAAHAEVTEYAAAAQVAHAAMLASFAEADALRKDADAEQASFVGYKVQADARHHAFVDAMTGARDIEQVIAAIRGGPSPERGERGMPSAAQRAEAEDIFEKFRKGEKLSTEDLIALQKGGRL